MIREHGDVAVLGAGFAGSIMAQVLQRIGRTVVLLERGVHPRFAIGESSTPLANLALEEISRTYDLPQLLPVRRIRILAEGVSPPGGGVEARLHVHAAPGGPALPPQPGPRQRAAGGRQPGGRRR